eukprot:gene1852-3597_t
MTEKIGILWQEGEALASSGSIHTGIVSFLKAKALLNEEKKNIAEGNVLSEQQNQRTISILASLLDKLSVSIERNATVLEKNPILALELPLRFTKTDVKKAYRRSALKYHPDKNADCDTSRVFTIIQSAYEKLMTIAPEGPATVAENKTGTGTSTGTKPRPQPPPSTSSTSTSSYSNSSSSSSSTKPSSNSSQYKTTAPTPTSAYPDASTMTTDQLREVVREFGFLRADAMSRGELLKKYLAVKAHVDFVTPSTSKNNNNNNSNSNSNSSSSTPSFNGIDAGLARAWTEEMRKEMNKDRIRIIEHEREKKKKQEKIDKKKAAAAATTGTGAGMGTGTSSSASTSSGPTTSSSASGNTEKMKRRDSSGANKIPTASASASAGGCGGGGTATSSHAETESFRYNNNSSNSNSGGVDNDSRGDKADKERKVRVQRLKEELPSMTVAELRRLVLVSGISDAGCVEKVDLLTLLYNHFGISLPSPDSTAGHYSNAAPASNAKDTKDRGGNKDGNKEGNKVSDHDNVDKKDQYDVPLNSARMKSNSVRPLSAQTNRRNEKDKDKSTAVSSITSSTSSSTDNTSATGSSSSALPVPKVSNKMDISSLRNVLNKSGVATTTAVTDNEDYSDDLSAAESCSIPRASSDNQDLQGIHEGSNEVNNESEMNVDDDIGIKIPVHTNTTPRSSDTTSTAASTSTSTFPAMTDAKATTSKEESRDRDRGVMTREKLRALEQKVRGGKAKHRPSSSEGNNHGNNNNNSNNNNTSSNNQNRSSSSSDDVYATPRQNYGSHMNDMNHHHPVGSPGSGLPPRPSPMYGGGSGSGSGSGSGVYDHHKRPVFTFVDEHVHTDAMNAHNTSKSPSTSTTTTATATAADNSHPHAQKKNAPKQSDNSIELPLDNNCYNINKTIIRGSSNETTEATTAANNVIPDTTTTPLEEVPTEKTRRRSSFAKNTSSHKNTTTRSSSNNNSGWSQGNSVNDDDVDPAEWRFVLIDEPEDKSNDFLKYFTDVPNEQSNTPLVNEQTYTDEDQTPVLDTDKKSSLDDVSTNNNYNDLPDNDTNDGNDINGNDDAIHLPSGGFGQFDFNYSESVDQSSDNDIDDDDDDDEEPVEWMPRKDGKVKTTPAADTNKEATVGGETNSAVVQEESNLEELEADIDVEKYNKRLLKAFLSSFNMKANINPLENENENNININNSSDDVNVKVGVMLLSDSDNDDEDDDEEIHADHLAGYDSSYNVRDVNVKMKSEAQSTGQNTNRNHNSTAENEDHGNTGTTTASTSHSVTKQSSVQRLRTDAEQYRRDGDGCNDVVGNANANGGFILPPLELHHCQQQCAEDAHDLQQEVEFWINKILEYTVDFTNNNRKSHTADAFDFGCLSDSPLSITAPCYISISMIAAA